MRAIGAPRDGRPRRRATGAGGSAASGADEEHERDVGPHDRRAPQAEARQHGAARWPLSRRANP